MQDSYNYVLDVYDSVQDIVPTLTANQYDYYKPNLAPVAQTIKHRTKKTWNEILSSIGLPSPLDRKTLAQLSRIVHLLERKMKDILKVGWAEMTFDVGGKKLRPDSFFVERHLVDDERFFLLDVKLCISASTITTYKYLPLFEKRNRPKKDDQDTFFKDWLPSRSVEKPLVHYDKNGQTSLALMNNVLYIAYLVGKPKQDLIPCSSIRGIGRRKNKTIPKNMEIRYVDFFDLPRLYCDLADVEYDFEKIEPLLTKAKSVKNLIFAGKRNTLSTGKQMYEEIKSEFR